MKKHYQKPLNLFVSLTILLFIFYSTEILIRVVLVNDTQKIFGGKESMEITPWELVPSQSSLAFEADLPFQYKTLTFTNPFGESTVARESMGNFNGDVYELGSSMVFYAKGPSSAAEELAFYKDCILTALDELEHTPPPSIIATLDEFNTIYEYQMYFLHYDWSEWYLFARREAFIDQLFYILAKSAFVMHHDQDTLFYFDDSSEIRVIGQTFSNSYVMNVYDRNSDQYYWVMLGFNESVENHQEYIYYILQSMSIE